MTKRRLVKVCIVILMFVVLAVYSACGQQKKSSANQSKKTGSQIASLLSYYGDRLLFVQYWGGIAKPDYAEFVEYDFSTKKIRTFNRTNDGYDQPIYSWDGKKIAYALIKGDNANICVMNADGSNVQQLTHDYLDDSGKSNIREGEPKNVIFNISPSFSPDGKRLIFMRAAVKRQRTLGRGTMFSAWDIFEVDIETKAVKQLTHYRFYEISRPYYLPDGKQFIFWAEGPKVQDKNFQENYQKQYQNNNIFIMDGVNNTLHPAIVHGVYTSQPSITRDGTILFVARTNEMDGLPSNPYNYDLFLKKGETITRVTKNQGYIRESSISFNGNRILFEIVKKTDGRSNVYPYTINSDGTGLREISYPDVILDTQ